ncbi:MAG: SH3 domain-containing protein [Lachnospiraceae bacterium]|nr:SH3 domain-containing protein [Lachnospiraceae bacterium]
MITNMKRSFLFFLRFCCLLVLFLCLAAPIRSRAFEVTEKSGFAQANTGVNVRTGPGKDYYTLGSLKAGEEVYVTGITDNGWYEIKYKGETGYVYSDYLADADLTDGSVAETQESKDSEAKTDASAAETTVSETEETQTGLTLPIVNITIPWLTRTLLYVLAAIVIILIVIISTLLSFRRDGDDDEEDDEDYEEASSSRRSSGREEFSREEYEAALQAANQKIAALQREIDYLKRTRR